MSDVITKQELDAADTNVDATASPAERGAEEMPSEAPPDEKKAKRLQLSISVRGLVMTVLIVALVAGVGTLGWLFVGAERKLDAANQKSDNYAHAEKLALDYAVNAAQMNYQDLGPWRDKLVAGTSPELNDKLTKAATSMEQILLPLQWSSTARPIAAKVRSDSGGVYVVDAFVSVLTKTIQTPEQLQSTATYSVTIDSGKSWQITDVGGVGAVTGEK